MRTHVLRLAALVGLIAGTVTAAAQSTFTYQGRLRQAGVALNGPVDLQFRLYSAATGGTQIGSTLTFAATPVVDGLITTDLDFGASAFDGTARWLQIAVRSPAGTGSYSNLTPRQPIRNAPYATYAYGGPGGAGQLWAANGSHIYKTNSGHVGIGTNAPAAPLEVRASADGRLRVAKIHTGGFGVTGPAVLELQSNFVGSDQPYGSIRFLDSDAAVRGSIDYGLTSGLLTPASLRFATDGLLRMAITADGLVGIGTNTPQSALHVIGAENNGTNAALRVVSGSQQLLLDGNEIDTNTTAGLHLNHNVTHNVVLATGGGNVGIGTSSPAAKLHVNGMARVDVLQIAGADLAERFPTSESDVVAPGTVMEIDPDHPGKLRIARDAYSRRVAGVVSGAGDLYAGAVLGHVPGHGDAPALALSGRVWVRCTAHGDAIVPGDLLTTSAVPGCAMAVRDPARAQGAILGKAMTSLAPGETGLVLVLVSLQ